MLPGRLDNEGRAFVITGDPPAGTPYLSGLPLSNEGQLYIAGAAPNPDLKLDLDFQNAGPLDPRITFARNSTATFLNDAGLLQEVATNVPRFEYDADGSPLGLLIEGARTNECWPSNLFSATVQVQGRIGWAQSASVAPDVAVSPDGTSNASRLPLGGTHRLLDNSGVVTAKIASVFFKSDGATSVTLAHNQTGETAVLDLASGAVTGTGPKKGVTKFPDGWWRLWYGYTPVSAIGNADYIQVTLDGGNVLAYGTQVEVASMSSYIPTVDAVVARSADDVTMTGTNFSDWYSAAEGTFGAKIKLEAANSAQRGVLNLQNVNIPIRVEANLLTVVGYLTGTLLASAASTFTNTISKIGSRYTSGAAAKLTLAANGVLGGEATGTVTLNNTAMAIGNTSGSYLFGHVQRIVFWDRALTDQEMIDLTGGAALRVFPTDPVTDALMVSIDGIIHNYNLGIPFDIDGKVVGTLNQTPNPDDPYVAGVRVSPDTGVYFVTDTPVVTGPWSAGFSEGFGQV